ncbi:hypothetical protein [Pelomonas cellulosilytica]|uniref:Uncharacterized protein n=1 Tax=Pelomonas cellulosilytica TaxID=2906762 RepID=A0ABS8XY71_9BURK|nr:hypothetical protein [Pelomonas sp. P8]MCE4554280.1 hypothetical protein [Pelomonas sp. P8]
MADKKPASVSGRLRPESVQTLMNATAAALSKVADLPPNLEVTGALPDALLKKFEEVFESAEQQGVAKAEPANGTQPADETVDSPRRDDKADEVRLGIKRTALGERLVRRRREGREHWELGLWARWLCVLSVASKYPTKWEEKLIDLDAPTFASRVVYDPSPKEGAGAGRVHGEQELSGSSIGRLLGDVFRLTSAPRSVEAIGDLGAIEHLRHWFNALLIRDGRPLSVDDIAERRAYLGANPAKALARFEEWLIHGVCSPAFTEEDDAELTPPPSRKAGRQVPENLCQKVADDVQAGPNSAPVVNVVCGNALEERRQLVGKVVDVLTAQPTEEGKEVEKPWVFYFDLRGADGSLLAPAEVLARLAKIYAIEFDAAVLGSSDRVFRDTMMAVRRACTIHPTLIVLDGLDETSGRHVPLQNLMRGRRWDEFIRVLCQPDWHWAHQFGLERVRTARFLVTSSEPLSGIKGWGGEVHYLPDVARYRPANVVAAPWFEMAQPLTTKGTQRQALLHLVMMAFVAASPDGISYGAMYRGVGYWLDLLGRIEHKPSTEDLRSLTSKRHLANLAEQRNLQLFWSFTCDEIHGALDEPLPWVTDLRMRYEWQASASKADLPDGSDVNVKLLFKSEAQRTRFLRTIMCDWNPTNNPNGAKKPEGGWAGGVALGDQLYRMVNLAIAIESLAQATSQLRSPDSRDALKLSGVRRLVQTVYHLRAAGDIEIKADGEGEYAAYLSIPKSAGKRFRYAYAFLYRRCIEGSTDFRLTRTHGRSDLRMPLLALFLVDDVRKLEAWWPGHEPGSDYFLKALDEGIRRWEKMGETAVPLVKRIGDLDADKEPDGRELVADVVLNLAVAAVDAGDKDVAEWALRRIDAVDKPFKEASSALFAHRSALIDRDIVSDAWSSVVAWEASLGGAYAKLRFDYLDLEGETDAATSHVEHSLIRLRVPADYLTTVSGKVKKLCAGLTDADEAYKGEPYSVRELESRLDKVLKDILVAGHSDRVRLVISEMLCRYADILATKADNLARESAVRKDRLEQLLEAFAHFYIADRVRSHVSGKSGFGTAWASVSGKPSRVYTRTCLSIARCVVEIDDVDPDETKPKRKPASAERRASLYSSAEKWVQHAANRVDVYVRHLGAHRRESIHGSLLMAAVVRTWVTVAAKGVARRDAWDPQAPQLEHALSYLLDADRVLNDMGAPQTTELRVRIERVCWLIGRYNELAARLRENPRVGGRGNKKPSEPLKQQKERQLSTLGQLIALDLRGAWRLGGDSGFYKPLIRRQQMRWNKAIGVDLLTGTDLATAALTA